MPPEPFSVTVHGSMAEPPHELAIRPMGTSRSFWRRAPNSYSTAEKLGTVFGVQGAQVALMSFAGVFACTSGTRYSRTLGRSAAAIVSFALADWVRFHCMLDW